MMKLKNWMVLVLIAGCATPPKHSLTKQSATAMPTFKWIPDAESNREPATDDPNMTAAYIDSVQRAQVWSPPKIDDFDMVTSDYPNAEGPTFSPGDAIACKYNETATIEKKKTSGKTQKFWCDREGDKKPLKVKYFSREPRENREIFAGIVSTRLFRALGFMANRTYSVSVNCEGCRENPWSLKQNEKIRTTPFSPALIEFKPDAKTIPSPKMGWIWKDLDLISADLPMEQQEAMKTHRGALKILAAFVGHSDSKAEQQSIVCLDELKIINGRSFCDRPLMYVHDLGATWGGGGKMTNESSKFSFEAFLDDCTWDDVDTNPKIHLTSSYIGSLKNDELRSISENSRVFIVDLMRKFASNPERVRKMFDVAQVDKLHQMQKEKITVDHWVSAFNIKLNELSAKACFKETREKLVKAAKAGQKYSVSMNQ